MMASIASFKRAYLLLLCAVILSCDNDPNLYRVYDGDDCGYANANGKMKIPFGRYAMCHSDTLKSHAIVLDYLEGFVAIDKDAEVLFEVFNFDNGPNYPSEGLFRIIENGKIGYANLDGEIVIPPKFECAHPFENGKAKVGLQCTEKYSGEHYYWESDGWYHIDKTGNPIE